MNPPRTVGAEEPRLGALDVHLQNVNAINSVSGQDPGNINTLNRRRGSKRSFLHLPAPLFPVTIPICHNSKIETFVPDACMDNPRPSLEMAQVLSEHGKVSLVRLDRDDGGFGERFEKEHRAVSNVGPKVNDVPYCSLRSQRGILTSAKHLLERTPI